ncbi:MAG: HAD hydrolase family protein [Moraxella osloensis]
MSKPTARPKKPKIVFFDIDDTLYIKLAEKVPQSAIEEALKQLKQQGIMVAIATGRGRAVFPKLCMSSLKPWVSMCWSPLTVNAVITKVSC